MSPNKHWWVSRSKNRRFVQLLVYTVPRTSKLSLLYLLTYLPTYRPTYLTTLCPVSTTSFSDLNLSFFVFNHSTHHHCRRLHEREKELSSKKWFGHPFERVILQCFEFLCVCVCFFSLFPFRSIDRSADLRLHGNRPGLAWLSLHLFSLSGSLSRPYHSPRHLFGPGLALSCCVGVHRWRPGKGQPACSVCVCVCGSSAPGNALGMAYPRLPSSVRLSCPPVAQDLRLRRSLPVCLPGNPSLTRSLAPGIRFPRLVFLVSLF